MVGMQVFRALTLTQETDCTLWSTPYLTSLRHSIKDFFFLIYKYIKFFHFSL